jgi:hypothetical protein
MTYRLKMADTELQMEYRVENAIHFRKYLEHKLDLIL